MANQAPDMDARIGAVEAHIEDLTSRVSALEVATTKPVKDLVPKDQLESFQKLLAAIETRMPPGRLQKDLADEMSLKPGTLGKFRREGRCGHAVQSTATRWFWKKIEPMITETVLLAFDTNVTEQIIYQNRSDDRLAVRVTLSDVSLFEAWPIYSIVEPRGEVAVSIKKLKPIKSNELIRLKYGYIDTNVTNARVAGTMMLVLNELDVGVLADG